MVRVFLRKKTPNRVLQAVLTSKTRATFGGVAFLFDAIQGTKDAAHRTPVTEVTMAQVSVKLEMA